MTPERWERVKELFESALQHAPARRKKILEEACGEDQEMLREVESLLAAHERAGSFIEAPACRFPHTIGVSSSDHAPLFSPGEVVGDRYRVTRFIARGGMGEVYAVEDQELHAHVALKTAALQSGADTRQMERFKREIQLARKVTHPNVCRIFDFGCHRRGSGSESGAVYIPFLTMELVEGETLSDRIERVGRITATEALPIIEQMAAALDAAHTVGVIHRDFKSNNIVLVKDPAGSEGFRVVITDFGTARSIVGEDAGPRSSTTAGIVVGTPAYMAPEQVEGGEISPATDVYALGVVIYEALTGQYPYTGDDPLTIAVKRLHEDPVLPSAYTPDLDPTWEQVILRCLRRDPRDRFQSASDVVRAIRGEPLPTEAIDLPKLRLPLTLATPAILVLLLAGMPGRLAQHAGTAQQDTRGAGLSHVDTRNRQSVAVMGFKNLTHSVESAWLSTALAEMLSTELAAGQKVRVIPGETVVRVKTELALPDSDCYAPDTLARIRLSLGADFIVVGSYLALEKTGQIRIDLRVQDVARGETIFANPEAGNDLLDLVSDIGGRLRMQLGAAEISPMDADRLKSSHPANSDAIRFYAEGLDKLRLFDALGARELFQKAISADPRYPHAHAALSAAWAALGYDSNAQSEANTAVELSSGLRLEDRLAFKGRYYETTYKWEQAAEAYRTLYAFFPDDIEYALPLAKAQAMQGGLQESLATIDSLRHLPPPANEDPRIDLAESSTAHYLCDYPRQLASARRAAKKAIGIGARLLLARAQLDEAWALQMMGDQNSALDCFQSARKTYAEVGDQSKVARSLEGIGWILSRRLDLNSAEEALRGALRIRRAIGDRTGTASALNNLAGLLYSKGDIQGAKALMTECVAVRREVGDKKRLGIVLGNLGQLVRDQGDLAYAERLFKEQLEISQEVGSADDSALALAVLGDLEFRRGRLAPAVARLDEVLSITTKTGQKRYTALAMTWLAEIAICKGDLFGARRKCEEAIEISRRIGDKIQEVWARFTLVRLTIEEGRAEQAEQELRTLLGRLSKDEMGAAYAQAMELLAGALLAQDKVSDAETTIQLATTQDYQNRLHIALTAARIAAAMGRSFEAIERLRALQQDFRKIGDVRSEYDVRLAIGEIEMNLGNVEAAQRQYLTLEKEARARGFITIANKASTAVARMTLPMK